MIATMTRKKPAALVRAEQALADLIEEQRTLDDRASAARRDNNAQLWMRLVTRGEELPGEISEARVRLLRLELEKAWVAVERLHAVQEPLAQAWTDARAQLRDHGPNRPRRPVGSPSETEWSEWELAGARLREEREKTDYAHRHALHATALAFVEVERLEAALEAATGERPMEGAGLRAPVRRLRKTVTAVDPTSYVPARCTTALGQGARQMVLPAGTVPPRWAVLFVTNPKAWEGADDGATSEEEQTVSA